MKGKLFSPDKYRVQKISSIAELRELTSSMLVLSTVELGPVHRQIVESAYERLYEFEPTPEQVRVIRKTVFEMTR